MLSQHDYRCHVIRYAAPGVDDLSCSANIRTTGSGYTLPLTFAHCRGGPVQRIRGCPPSNDRRREAWAGSGITINLCSTLAHSRSLAAPADFVLALRPSTLPPALPS